MPVLAQIEKNFPKDVREIFRAYPLIGTPEQPFHDKAALSFQAANAAAKQGKFWEMHDFLFENQKDWTSLSVSDFEKWLPDQVEALGLDQAQFTKDLTDPANAALAQQAWDDAYKSQIPGTPFILINGQVWPESLPRDYNGFEAVIKLNLLEKRQFTTCPPMTIDKNKQYTATLHTSKGDIVIQLFADKAPLAVNSFIFLAQHGWFDNVMFHRVLPNFVAQVGDPTGTGYGGPGYAFDNEISPDLKFNKPGVVAMANAGPGSNGSQFFITYNLTAEQQARLNGSYTIFGQVISGMDVADKLTPRDPSQAGELPPGDVIQSVTIGEK